ncbi:MAG: Methyl-accepting transducer protein [Acidobacteriota bacterium]|nr:Methyl-accepting transducer protein [Acidobacteriota bacterium]
MAQRIDHDPATDRMSRTTRTTGVRTESGSLAVPAMLLAGIWAAGGWLLAGASRDANAPLLQAVFHLAALACAGLFLFFDLSARASDPGSGLRARLIGVFRHLGDGDLVRASELARTLDADLADGVGRAVAGLATRVEQLQTSSHSVAGAGEGVDRGSTVLAASSAQQAAAAGEVTAAMEELSRTAAEISEHAERQNQLVLTAENEGAAGAEAVAEAVEGVGAVERRIADVTARADTLGTRSREIFRVLDLISDIAQETHLLSLNAALEASAAGGRGRRFAVVAGEVRVLAERVRDSVASVRSQIEEFASAIRSTVVATEEGGKEAARVLEEARAATQALGILRASLSESSEAARQISSVTRQQTSATEEVLSTLRELHQVVERMSRDLAQLSATSGRLHTIGLDLELLAQTFHLDSPRSLKRLVHDWARRLPAAATTAGSPWTGAQEWIDELVGAAAFVECGCIVDTRGKVIATQAAHELRASCTEALQDLRRRNLSDRAWFKKALESSRAIVTPPERSVMSGEPCIMVAVARRDAAGQPLAVVEFDVNVRHWTEIGE